MPVSVWLGLEDGLAEIVSRRPGSVLDAGIGFGLWGALLRQYLDVWSGRIQPHEWTTRIDGIEVDGRRVQPHARALYTEILVGDIRELVPVRAAEQRYDVVLFGDVIEHLPKPDGQRLLATTVQLAGQAVVVRIPLGNGWRREGREEPDHHRSQWYPEDFAGYPGQLRQYDFSGNPYGLVVIEAGQGRLLTELDRRLARVEERIERLAGPC